MTSDSLAALSSLYASDESEDDSDAERARGGKRRRIHALEPELPAPQLGDCSSSDDVRGGTADHSAGCIRQFPHEAGQFAEHVFLPLTLSSRWRAALSKCTAQLEARAGATMAAASCSTQRMTTSVHTIAHDALHVSLSRTAMLPFEKIDGFVEALKKALRQCPAVSAPINRDLCELSNDTQTRFFAAIELCRGSSGYAALSGLISAVGAIFGRYGLPSFYEERRLHFSIAWSLVPLPAMPPLAETLLALQMREAMLTFESVCCRVGERTTTVRLQCGNR